MLLAEPDSWAPERGEELVAGERTQVAEHEDRGQRRDGHRSDERVPDERTPRDAGLVLRLVEDLQGNGLVLVVPPPLSWRSSTISASVTRVFAQRMMPMPMPASAAVAPRPMAIVWMRTSAPESPTGNRK